MPQENPDLAAASSSPLAEGDMGPLAGSPMPPEAEDDGEDEVGMSSRKASFEDMLSI